MTVIFSHYNKHTVILMMYNFLLHTTRFLFPLWQLCVSFLVPCHQHKAHPAAKKRTSSLWPFSEPLSIIKDLKSEGLELRLKLSYISAWTTQQGAGDNIFSIGGILSLGYGRHCMLCTVSCILHTVLCVCIIFWSHLIHILIV